MAIQTTKIEPRNDFKTCQEMTELCAEIGGIAEVNAHYGMMLARKVQQSGKQIQDWTLGELNALNEQMGEIYNSMIV